MVATDKSPSPKIRQGDLWASLVTFTVTLSLHIGIVLFISLALALAVYALASTIGNAPTGVSVIAWCFTVLTLIVWGIVVKLQARGFRPHAIHGIGRIVVATSGCERGEIAADIGAGLIGIANLGPLLHALITKSHPPDSITTSAALIGALLAAVGWGSLVLRMILHRRRLKRSRQGHAACSQDSQRQISP
jgi:hypothetical protein